MLIGCPKEIKPQEFRVGMTPARRRRPSPHGHEVIIEAGAGAGAGFTDDDYRAGRRDRRHRRGGLCHAPR
jgi:alanine dehydrogenase